MEGNYNIWLHLSSSYLNSLNLHYLLFSPFSTLPQLAPVGLVIVTIMLYFFRLVYSEVVTAMPVNGGTYNLILNTTNKKTAGLVACLSILSYIATAIVSGFDSILYLTTLWPSVGE